MSDKSIGHWDHSDWNAPVPLTPLPVLAQLTELSLEALRQIVQEELQAQAHQIALDVAEELTRALRLERNIRQEKEKTKGASREHEGG